VSGAVADENAEVSESEESQPASQPSRKETSGLEKVA
jgi:hypothetical protein